VVLLIPIKDMVFGKSLWRTRQVYSTSYEKPNEWRKSGVGWLALAKKKHKSEVQKSYFI
jgi:hypothetical protein